MGKVGQAFATLVVQRRAILAQRYGVDLQLEGIASSNALWQAKKGPPIETLLDHLRGTGGWRELPGVEAGSNGSHAIAVIEAEVLVDASIGRLSDGEPSHSHIRAALERGWHVVAASKGALVRHYPALRTLAVEQNARLRFGGATAAALPTVDLVEHCLAGANVLGMEGILNGTSNFILSQMADGALSFDEALHVAQERGIAEPDPRLDVEGWDTAAKLVLIGNAVWDVDLTLEAVSVRGIADLTREDMARAAQNGEVLKLVGDLRQHEGRGEACVEPRALPADHPLAHVHGAEKGAVFFTDTMDRIAVTGGKSDPVGAAAALLRDVLHVCRS